MAGKTRKCLLAITGLSLALVHCAGEPDQAELERLRRENEELQAKVEQLERDNLLLRGQPDTAGDVYAHFAKDAQQGTLAGLLPGDELPQARFRFGQENRTRSWRSEGRTIFQYEWNLEGGLILRINADGQGRLEKIAAVLEDPRGVNIPTLAGLRLGQETFASVQQKFGEALTTNLQLWGAQGYYTVAQRTPLPAGSGSFVTRRRLGLEFLYQMPAGLSPGELERIGEEVMRRNNAAVLEPHLRAVAPFSIALFEIR